MKLAVIGSRGFDNYAQLCQELDQMEGIECIISGGAIGADRMASRFAREHNIPLMEYLPDYAKFGRSAPLKRNETIIQSCDQVIAFWDGQSRGTANALGIAKKLNRIIKIVKY